MKQLLIHPVASSKDDLVLRRERHHKRLGRLIFPLTEPFVMVCLVEAKEEVRELEFKQRERLRKELGQTYKIS